MIVWSTSDPKPNARREINMTRIYYRQSPEAVLYGEDAAAVFDLASQQVDPVYRTDSQGHLLRSSFANGPILTVGDGDDISFPAGSGRLTKHGMRVTLKEFHAAHMVYQGVTEHRSTPNYVPSDGMNYDAHVLRMSIEHGDTDNIELVVDPLPPFVEKKKEESSTKPISASACKG